LVFTDWPAVRAEAKDYTSPEKLGRNVLFVISGVGRLYPVVKTGNSGRRGSLG
jgi:hypothetical protein